MNRPPPTKPAEDNGFLHRRNEDAVVFQHSRWYDSTKVHIAIIATILGLLAGAVAIGYSTRDLLRTVEGTDARWSTHMANEAEQWAAIHEVTASVSSLKSQMNLTLSVISEIHCVVASESERQRAACASEETRRRLEHFRNGGT